MFKRHRYLTYQGYAFPWYVLLIWVLFLIGGSIYFMRFIVMP